VYLALGRGPKERQGAYGALFRAHLEREAIDGIRLALNQGQPLGNERFYANIERMTGVRREARPRGRPRRELDAGNAVPPGQGGLEL
jgi:putative transposase